MSLLLRHGGPVWKIRPLSRFHRCHIDLESTGMSCECAVIQVWDMLPDVVNNFLCLDAPSFSLVIADCESVQILI